MSDVGLVCIKLHEPGSDPKTGRTPSMVSGLLTGPVTWDCPHTLGLDPRDLRPNTTPTCALGSGTQSGMQGTGLPIGPWGVPQAG